MSRGAVDTWFAGWAPVRCVTGATLWAMTDTSLPGDLRGTLIERMGLEFVEVGAEHLVARMPVDGNTQPYGLLHGGASCVLAETLGSVGAATHAASLGGIA